MLNCMIDFMIEEVLKAVVEVTGVTERMLISKSTREPLNIARGMFVHIGRSMGCEYKDLALRINRTVPSISVTAHRYKSLCEKDAEMRLLRDKIQRHLEGDADDGFELWSKSFHIKDVSSKHFGEYYIGYIDGEIFTSDKSFHVVANKMLNEAGG